LKTTPTPAKFKTPATYRLSRRLVHPSDRGWDSGICAPVTRIGLPGCVKRKVRIEAVYASVSVPERMIKPSYRSQFSETSRAIVFHSARVSVRLSVY
jgi:hypothetical protein